MTYNINIVENSRNWYDPRIAADDPIIFENVNYDTTNERSVTIVRQRYIQDWARRIIPNSIRQGVGLTDPAGASEDINITTGYAIVAGRFLEIPAGTFNATTEGLTSAKTYYLVIQVGTITESDIRHPDNDESAVITAIDISGGYTASHNELVLAKFYYTGTVINNFEDYTAEQEWQASVLSPVPARPGISSGTNNIILRAGFSERINNLGIEPSRTRFYLNALFEDQIGSTDVQLTNESGVLITSVDGDTNTYLGQDMLNLLIGGTQVIDSSRNLTNIGTLNTHTIPGGTDTFVMRDTTDTLTNKTLTSPQIDEISLASGGAITIPDLGSDTFVLINETQVINNKIMDTMYLEATGDISKALISVPASWTNSPNLTIKDLSNSEDFFVFENETQDLDKKTLTNVKINEDVLMTATATELNQLDGVSVGGNTSGDIITTDNTQTLSNKTLTTPYISNFTNATHNHQNTSSGGTIHTGFRVNGTFLDNGNNLQGYEITYGSSKSWYVWDLFTGSTRRNCTFVFIMPYTGIVDLHLAYGNKDSTSQTIFAGVDVGRYDGGTTLTLLGAETFSSTLSSEEFVDETDVAVDNISVTKGDIINVFIDANSDYLLIMNCYFQYTS